MGGFEVVPAVLTDAETDSVLTVVGRGGIIVMRPLLVHASSKSAVPGSRRVLHLEYASTMSFEPDLRLRVA